MKVLHFLDSMSRGGAETQALDVCRNAASFGIDLTLAVTGDGELFEQFKDSGAHFIKLRRRFPVDPVLIKQLRSIILNREIEITQGYQAVESLHLYLATRGLGVKNLMSFQGFIPGRKNRAAARFLIPRLDANIFVSRGFEAWLRTDFGLNDTRNFHLIYNGADQARLKPTDHSVRGELGIGDGEKVLGMVANFTKDRTKDQLTICRALPEVFSKFPSAHFIFAGRIDAPEKVEACREVCEKNGILQRVHFLGARNDVPDILNALDIFVFSSLYEGLPLAVTEAMLSKIPLVLSDIEPLREVSDGGRCAEMFCTRDHGQLSEKIIKLLADEAYASELAERAEIFARSNFTIEAHLKSLTKLYRSLLD